MRDQEVYRLVNDGVNRLAQATSITFHKMAREIDELRAHVTAETIRRQVLEEMLIEVGVHDGKISKAAYEQRYEKAIEDYNKKVADEIAKAEEAMKKEQEAAAAGQQQEPEPERKPTIYGPDGVTPVEARA